MASTIRPTTAGNMGFWNGTKDDLEGYIDYATGESNINSPQEINITVENIQALNEKPTFAKNGFEMRNVPSSLSAAELLAGNTPEGKATIQGAYYAECTRILEQVIGSNVKVMPSYFKVRQAHKTGEGTKSAKDPALPFAPRPFAHVDRDDNTIQIPIRDVVGEEEAAKLMTKYKRWAQVNVWRPIENKATKWPLAMIGHQDVPEWDYGTHMGRVYSRNDARNAYRGEKAYDSVAKFDPRYKYYYANDMTPDECWIFCSYDSRRETVAPHGAFWDQNTPEDAPERSSIEVRFLAFFDEQE